MIPDYPEPPQFVVSSDRLRVTGETQLADSGFDPRFGDHSWLRFCDQGGGSVPLTHEWTSNPKQRQDEGG